MISVIVMINGQRMFSRSFSNQEFESMRQSITNLNNEHHEKMFMLEDGYHEVDDDLYDDINKLSDKLTGTTDSVRKDLLCLFEDVETRIEMYDTEVVKLIIVQK